MTPIPLSRPSLTSLEREAIEEVLESGWLGEGAQTKRFEDALRDFTGAPHVIAVNTGTSALRLSLDVLAIGPGDEVIVPSFNFASGPATIARSGARPIFADIQAETLNLDAAHVETLITPRTRAIMTTDYAGLPSDVPALRDAVAGRDIRIIRDAAHSFGSKIGGKPLGVRTGEDITCFSFDPIKNLTCGEGGAILTNNAAWADEMQLKKRLGFRRGGWDIYCTETGPSSQSVDAVGFRFHLSNLNAAIGLAQLTRFPELARRRQEIARLYDRRLEAIDGIRTFEKDYDDVVPFIFAIMTDSERVRDDLAGRLRALGISAGLRYFPCHREKAFQPWAPANPLPETDRAAQRLLCLPIYPDLTDDEVEHITGLLATAIT